MAVLISGKLIGPNGDPRPGVTIMLTAVKTSSAVVHLAPSSSTTGADGSYSLSVEVGTHNVMIEAYGRPFEKVGQITVYSDSKPGTLNDFLTTPGADELTPAIVAMVDDMRTAAAAYANAAADAATRAEAARDNTENIADANTYYATSTDPDGTIAGLAGTQDGKSFRVAIQDATLSVVAFNYYLNKSGVAEFITSYPNKRYLDMVNELADSTDRRTRGLLTLKRRKKPVDFVSRQGASMFSINENSEKEMPGKTFSDYMNILRALVIGPSALRRARPGYLFNLVAGGFRLLAVRDDGVGTLEYRGIPMETHIGLLQNTLGGFGDSLTDNGRNPAEAGKPRGWTYNARSWQMWASLFSDGRIKYIGQWATGGYTTADMIRDHLKPAIAAKPRFITFLGGRNDVIQTNGDGSFKFSLTAIKNNIKYILTEFRKNGVIPVVCSMAAQNNSDPALKYRENVVNAFLHACAIEQGLPFVNMRAVTVDPVTDGWKAGYNGKLPDGSPDPSHPSSLGAFHMGGKALVEAIEPFIMPVYPQLAIANPVTEGGANAIINPLFLDTSGGIPTGWAVEGGGVSITSDPAVVGNVLVVTGIGTTIPRVSQTVAVTPGETRTFSFRVKTDVTLENSTACYCEANDVFNTNIAGIRTWRHSTGGFMTFSYDVTIPVDVTEVKVIIAANAGQISVGQMGLIKVETV
ncbi:prophage tail fiber N-terminal domain-containing protein [Serratia proteamaculans]|uniref:prophage tail fiber N-terminal domain-containing protein n=1 Tax=Serratia proteamaculans TaxID=28151 RepID=UPI00217BB77E|nr:prophage tail fiber N-terminal domain-containing protein [Serratia proteamaculans]CAI1134343.1 Prophage tail fibre N-terminal [Serratia proteamaculans]CAI1176636.1 Prophage tail fibre N-terminal [Serratia proteamaculans]